MALGQFIVYWQFFDLEKAHQTGLPRGYFSSGICEFTNYLITVFAHSKCGPTDCRRSKANKNHKLRKVYKY